MRGPTRLRLPASGERWRRWNEGERQGESLLVETRWQRPPATPLWRQPSQQQLPRQQGQHFAARLHPSTAPCQHSALLCPPFFFVQLGSLLPRHAAAPVAAYGLALPAGRGGTAAWPAAAVSWHPAMVSSCLPVCPRALRSACLLGGEMPTQHVNTLRGPCSPGPPCTSPAHPPRPFPQAGSSRTEMLCWR